MFSSEFTERFFNGQKEFDKIEFNYADLSGRAFDGLKLKNSKITFTSLRDCKFNNVVFENCDFFFGAFGRSTFENVRFVNCTIDYSGFTWATFNNSEMTNCRISWTSFVDANIGGLELKNCSEFNVFKEISQFTTKIFEKSIEDLQPLMQHMDLDTRQKIQQLIDTFTKRYNMQVNPKMGETKANYEPSKKDTYGAFDALIDTAISTYGANNIYKTKNIYETKTHYRQV
ncbi:MAG: pentapeptide repeat-containing protein [Candidatus Aenigmarchaeota archaeon]|nr:pentapeptide repeat-containing protein [Candidatus Aenigmarchaeota archaeon]